MKRLSIVFSLFVFVCYAEARTYTTSFTSTENPISENSNWTNGETDGIDWEDVETKNGRAHGTQTGSGGYDDSTALLTGIWGNDQEVSATVYSANYQCGDIYEEIEIRLRSNIMANSNTGYEIFWRNCDDNSTYVCVVRWNGDLGDWTQLKKNSGKKYAISNGDVVKATIVGATITGYVNDVQVIQVIDSTFKRGKPGIGFYLQGAGNNDDFGFTDFTATDSPDLSVNSGSIPIINTLILHQIDPEK